MKEYTVNIKLVFNGTVKVKANTVYDAKRIVQQHIHACRPTVSDDADDRIIDWNVDSHSDTEVWFDQNGEGLEELDN